MENEKRLEYLDVLLNCVLIEIFVLGQILFSFDRYSTPPIWRLARIEDIFQQFTEIHFLGWDASWNEWLNKKQQEKRCSLKKPAKFVGTVRIPTVSWSNI